MGSITLWGGEEAGVGQEGTGGPQFPQRDRRRDRGASPRTGSPPLGPGCL